MNNLNRRRKSEHLGRWGILIGKIVPEIFLEYIMLLESSCQPVELRFSSEENQGLWGGQDLALAVAVRPLELSVEVCSGSVLTAWHRVCLFLTGLAATPHFWDLGSLLP